MAEETIYPTESTETILDVQPLAPEVDLFEENEVDLPKSNLSVKTVSESIDPIYRHKDGRIVTKQQLLNDGIDDARINNGINRGILTLIGDTEDPNQEFKHKDGRIVNVSTLMAEGISKERIANGLMKGIITPIEKKNQVKNQQTIIQQNPQTSVSPQVQQNVEKANENSLENSLGGGLGGTTSTPKKAPKTTVIVEPLINVGGTAPENYTQEDHENNDFIYLFSKKNLREQEAKEAIQKEMMFDYTAKSNDAKSAIDGINKINEKLKTEGLAPLNESEIVSEIGGYPNVFNAEDKWLYDATYFKNKAVPGYVDPRKPSEILSYLRNTDYKAYLYSIPQFFARRILKDVFGDDLGNKKWGDFSNNFNYNYNSENKSFERRKEVGGVEGLEDISNWANRIKSGLHTALVESPDSKIPKKEAEAYFNLISEKLDNYVVFTTLSSRKFSEDDIKNFINSKINGANLELVKQSTPLNFLSDGKTNVIGDANTYNVDDYDLGSIEKIISNINDPVLSTIFQSYASKRIFDEAIGKDTRQKPAGVAFQESFTPTYGKANFGQDWTKESLEQSAIRYFSSVDPQTGAQIKKLGGVLPDSMLGTLMENFIENPYLQNEAKNDARLNWIINDIKSKMYKYYPEYAKKKVAEKISQELEYRHYNWLYNAPSLETVNNAIEWLKGRGAWSAEDQKVFDEKLKSETGTLYTLSRDIGRIIPFVQTQIGENPYARPGVIERAISNYRNTLKDAARGIEDVGFAGIANITSPFAGVAASLVRDGLSESDFPARPKEDTEGNQRLYDILNNKYSTPNIEWSTAHEISGKTGDIIGFTVPLIASAYITRGKVGPSIVVNALTFEAHNRDRSYELFPDDPQARALYTATSTAVDAFLGELLPTKAIAKSFSKVAKNETATIINNLLSKRITADQAKQQFKDITNTLLRVAGKNLETTAVMSTFSLFHKTIDKIAGDTDYKDKSFGDITLETVKEAKTTFLTTPVLAIMGVKGGFGNSVKANYKVLYEMAKYPDTYKKAVLENKEATPEQKVEMLQNLQIASDVYRQLQDPILNLTDIQKQKYLVNATSKKIYELKAEQSTDKTLKEAYEQKAKEYGNILNDILGGKDKAQEAENYDVAEDITVSPEEQKITELTIEPSEKVTPTQEQPIVEGTEVITPEESDITVGEVIDKKGTYKGQKGTFYQDGQTVVFAVENSNREYELGNIDEIKDKSISDFDIEHERSVVSFGEGGQILVRGKEYKNLYSDPTKAINRDAEGNVISVTLDTPNGQKRTFRGNVAEDIANQIELNELNKNNESGKFEEFINEPEVKQQIDNATIPTVEQKTPVETNEPVSRQKIEPKTEQPAGKPTTAEKPTTTAEPITGEQPTEQPGVVEQTKKEAPQTKEEILSALEKAKKDRIAAKAKLMAIKKGFGISPQGEMEARVDYHISLVREAKLQIKLGIKTIEEFASALGEKITDALKDAWNEAIKVPANQLLNKYEKGTIISTSDLNEIPRSEDGIVNKVYDSFKNEISTIKIAGKRPQEGSAFYDTKNKQIEINKNSEHWGQVEADKLSNGLAHEYGHHLIEKNENRSQIEKDLSDIKEDLKNNRPQNMTDAEAQVYEYIVSEKNSPQEVFTYAISNPEFRKFLTKYSDKLNEISNKLIGENIITDKDIQENKLNLQNEQQQSQTKASTGEVKVNSEKVQYNGTDAIGSRGRSESEKNTSQQQAKEKIKNPGTNASLKAANGYNKSSGLPEVKQHKYKSTDDAAQTKIAQIYPKLQDVNSPTYVETPLERKIYNEYKNKYPEIFKKYDIKNYKDLVHKAYSQLMFESQRQYESLPVKLTFHEKGEGNYKNSNEMLDDVHNFNHLWVYKGGDNHTELGSKTMDANGLTANDKFRAVHDYFGHSVEGYQFGKIGEENAWVEHSKMFSPLAQWALSSETRGQNSWVNFSGVNKVVLETIKTASALRAQGEKIGNKEMVNEAEKLLDTVYDDFVFAEQKAIILPEKFTDINKYYETGIKDIPKELDISKGEPVKSEPVKTEAPKQEAPKSALEKAKEERKAAKAKLDQARKSMGITNQAELEALVDYHIKLVNEAKEYIKLGIKTAKEFAKELGENYTIAVQQAWDEATGKIKEIRKAEELGYTLDDLETPVSENTYLYDMTNENKRVSGFMRHLMEAENVSQETKDAFKKNGINYKVDQQKEARNVANDIINAFGENDALFVANGPDIHPTVASAIYGECINRAFEAEQNATSARAKLNAANRWAELSRQYDAKLTSSGKFSAYAAHFYKTSPLGFVLRANKENQQRFNEWAEGKEPTIKELYDKIMQTQEGQMLVQEQAENLSREQLKEERKKRDKAIDDFFNKAKLKGGTYATIIPPSVWNGAMDILSAATKGGDRIVIAVQKAIDHITSKIGDNWDKEKFRREYEQNLSEVANGTKRVSSEEQKLTTKIKNLEKQIDDLKQRIAKGGEEAGKKEKKSSDNPEVQRLIEERDRLKEENEKLLKENKIGKYSDESKLSESKKRALDNIKELERKLAENDIDFKKKTSPTDSELKSYRDRQKQLRDQIEKRRKEEGLGKYSELEKAQAEAKRKQAKIDELNRRINEKDFSAEEYKEKKQRDALDEELARVKEQYNEARKESDVYTEKKAKQFLEQFKKRLSGIDDTKKQEIVRRSIKKLIETGGLNEPEFRQIVAEVMGFKDLSTAQVREIESLTATVNRLESVENEMVDNPNEQTIAAYQKARNEALVAGLKLSSMTHRESDIPGTFKSMITGSLLGAVTLLKNPIGNTILQATYRFPMAVIRQGVESITYGGSVLINKLTKGRTPILSPTTSLSLAQKGFFGKGKEGLKQAYLNFMQGTQLKDYLSTSSYQSSLSPRQALKDLKMWKSGEIYLTPLEVTDRVIRTTLGRQPDVILRLMGAGDTPFRWAAEGSKAMQIGINELKIMDEMQLLSFIQSPEKVATKILISQGVSREKAIEMAAEIKERILYEGQKTVLENDNLITTLNTGLESWLSTKKSDNAGIKFLKGATSILKTSTLPFVKIPSNAYWIYFKLNNPSLSFSWGVGQSLIAARAYKKGDMASYRKYSELAKDSFYTTGVGLGYSAVATYLLSQGLIKASQTDEDTKREKTGERAFGKQNKLNWGKLVGDSDYWIDLTWFGPMGTLLDTRAQMQENELTKKVKGITEEEKGFFDETIDKMSISASTSMNNLVYDQAGKTINVLKGGGNAFDNAKKLFAVNTSNTFMNLFTGATYVAISKAMLPTESRLKGDTVMEEIVNNAKDRNVILRLFLGRPPERISIWGEPIKKDNSFSGVVQNMLGFEQGGANNFGAILYDDYRRTGNDKFFPPLEDNKIRVNGKDVTLTQSEKDDLDKCIGQARKSMVAPFVYDMAQIGSYSPEVQGYLNQLKGKNITQSYFKVNLEDKKYSELNDEQKVEAVNLLYVWARELGFNRFLEITDEKGNKKYDKYRKAEVTPEALAQKKIKENDIKIFKFENAPKDMMLQPDTIVNYQFKEIPPEERLKE